MSLVRKVVKKLFGIKWKQIHWMKEMGVEEKERGTAVVSKECERHHPEGSGIQGDVGWKERMMRIKLTREWCESKLSGIVAI